MGDVMMYRATAVIGILFLLGCGGDSTGPTQPLGTFDGSYPLTGIALGNGDYEKLPVIVASVAAGSSTVYGGDLTFVAVQDSAMYRLDFIDYPTTGKASQYSEFEYGVLMPVDGTTARWFVRRTQLSTRLILDTLGKLTPVPGGIRFDLSGTASNLHLLLVR